MVSFFFFQFRLFILCAFKLKSPSFCLSVFFLSFIPDRISRCISGWPWTHHLPSSTSWMLGFQICATAHIYYLLRLGFQLCATAHIYYLLSYYSLSINWPFCIKKWLFSIAKLYFFYRISLIFIELIAIT